MSARITLAHGAGGRASRDLIESFIVPRFGSASGAMEDQARLTVDGMAGQLALTTDSYVIDPLTFPGGNIGKLAVCGTLNDLAVGGARPIALTCGLILEEGLALDVLGEVLDSMADVARAGGVALCTGDTKVVPKGVADKLFINTAGVGVIPAGRNPRSDSLRPGDCVFVNGFLGDHGAAVVDARGEMQLDNPVASDCADLSGFLLAAYAEFPEIRTARDATRGGLATVLNEFADASGVSIVVNEAVIPVRDAVRGVCELLGLDPLYLANEGKAVMVVPGEQREAFAAWLRDQPLSRDAAMIGEVVAQRSAPVVMQTRFGGLRAIDVLHGDQLPRIC